MDAEADGDTVVIGWWRAIGLGKAAGASWVFVQIAWMSAPWAFAQGEPFRAIASLELFGMLASFMVLVPESEGFRGETSATSCLSCVTDNSGNPTASIACSRPPLAIILMELDHRKEEKEEET